jgi:hypothetical protein
MPYESNVEWHFTVELESEQILEVTFYLLWQPEGICMVKLWKWFLCKLDYYYP